MKRLALILAIALGLLLAPLAVAEGNAGIPAIFSFWLNIVLFPLVVLIEGWVYRYHRVFRPQRLSVVLNTVSSIVGFLVSLPLVIMVEIPNALMIVLAVLALYWTLTILVEWGFARKVLKRSNAELPTRWIV